MNNWKVQCTNSRSRGVYQRYSILSSCLRQVKRNNSSYDTNLIAIVSHSPSWLDGKLTVKKFGYVLTSAR